MSRSEIVSRILANAADPSFDTVMGRAFLRAIGVDMIEPRIDGTIVTMDCYEGLEALMAQRYGVAY